MDENKLFNELKKLAKRANQRILRLERLTGIKESFATKQLIDYLSSEPLKAITKSGRVKASKKMSETQMIATIKATKNFLASPLSKVKSVKEYKKQVEKSIGVDLSYSDVSTMYQAIELWDWAEDNYGSDFWTDLVPKIFKQSKDSWVSELSSMAEETNDETVRNKLKVIYDYIQRYGLRGVIHD